MKKVILFLTSCFFCSPIFAQNGVLSPKGISFPNYSTATRPAANTVGVGTVLYNSTDNTHQFSNGSAWLNLLGTTALPTGTTGQTLRNNGSGWVVDNTLSNDGSQVRIGTNTATANYLLTVGDGNNVGGVSALGSTYG